MIKIDAEGAESAVLAGAVEILQKYAPIIFLATHGREQHQDCVALLKQRGYSVEGAAGEAVDQTERTSRFAGGLELPFDADGIDAIGGTWACEGWDGWA